MQICRIVITGGPCAGKSSALERIRKEFSKKGWTVLVMAETATELISAGIAPWTCGTPTEYQRYQMHLQTEKERIFFSAAENMNAEKIMIVCDSKDAFLNRSTVSLPACRSSTFFLASAVSIERTLSLSTILPKS